MTILSVFAFCLPLSRRSFRRWQTQASKEQTQRKTQRWLPKRTTSCVSGLKMATVAHSLHSTVLLAPHMLCVQQIGVILSALSLVITTLYSSFTISSPDCTLHARVNHMITVLEWLTDSHMLYIIRNHTRLCSTISQY